MSEGSLERLRPLAERVGAALVARGETVAVGEGACGDGPAAGRRGSLGSGS